MLDRHRAGDPRRSTRSRARLYPSIHRIVYRLAGSRHRDAHEDLVQAALQQVCRSLDSFEGRSRLSSFVFGICHRVVARASRYDRVRSWYRRDAELATTSSEPVRADELCDRARSVDDARKRLDRLTSDERAAFVMFEVEELPLEDVAATLGLLDAHREAAPALGAHQAPRLTRRFPLTRLAPRLSQRRQPRHT